jgi:hypothetical protein
MVKGLKEKKTINGREVLIYGDDQKKRKKNKKRKNWKKILFANDELWDWSEETKGLNTKEKILHYLIWSVILLFALYVDIFHIQFLLPHGGAILLALSVYFFTGFLWSVGLWKYPSLFWKYLTGFQINQKYPKLYRNMELWVEKKTGVQFFRPGGSYTQQAYIVEFALFSPIFVLFGFWLLPKNANGMIFLGMITVWLIYPVLVMLIRLNTFSDKNIKNSSGKGYDPVFFWLHSFIIGFITTMGSITFYSIFCLLAGFNVVNEKVVIGGLLLGLTAETIILLPDKLGTMLKTDLKNESITKSIKLILYIFLGTIAMIITLSKVVKF